MKKLVPTILIALIIVNLFAPFSIHVSPRGVAKIQKQIASADTAGIRVSTTITKNDTTITVLSTVTWNVDNSTNDKIAALLQKSDGTGDIQIQDIPVETNQAQTIAYRAANPNDALPRTVQIGAVAFKDLTPDTEYTVKVVASQAVGFWGHPISYVWNSVTGGSNNDATSQTSTVKTSKAGQTAGEVIEVQDVLSPDEIMPVCGIFSKEGTIAGCAAQLLYYALFIPTSYLFALAGQFFDFTFGYSVNDKSYRSSFVVEGWGLVRDFVNMFFIFVLLYIAFSTILAVHGFKTKEMIVNVVIIGLLMNFSLFAAQIIIDSSNILARVFYNSNTIKITEGGANKVTEKTPGLTPGANNELPLSAAIVNKVNPQNLIINGSRNIKVVDKVTGTSSTAQTTSSGVGVGAFILITLLAIAVNVVGMIVFFSVGLILVARVIGLWIAMIFAPLAFFSYTVPSMQGMSLAGWKNWWPETLKLSFLAPIFIFFVYLILKFLSVGLNLVDADGLTGMSFIIATVVPFVFIMILLLKAKDIAKNLSGELGQKITGGIAAIGGLALGGAALGAAFAGRNVIGKGMAAASNTKGAKDMMKYRQDLKDFNSGKSTTHPGAAPKLGFVSRIGDRLNKKQEKVGEVDHARHEIDSLKEKAHLKDVPDGNLSAVDEKKIKDVYTKDKRSEAESIIRKDGYVDPHTKQTIVESEDTYKANNRGNLVNAAKTYKDPQTGLNTKIDSKGELTDAAKKEVENKLSADFNVELKAAADIKMTADYNHLRDESKEKVSGVDRTLARGNKASYDPRNLSQAKADKREGWLTKGTTALIAGIAMGVRTGIKTSGVNHGSGQNDLLKDLGHTITEAMKSAKVTVKVEESHGKSHDDGHGGGGGHH